MIRDIGGGRKNKPISGMSHVLSYHTQNSDATRELHWNDTSEMKLASDIYMVKVSYRREKGNEKFFKNQKTNIYCGIFANNEVIVILFPQILKKTFPNMAKTFFFFVLGKIYRALFFNQLTSYFLIGFHER